MATKKPTVEALEAKDIPRFYDELDPCVQEAVTNAAVAMTDGCEDHEEFVVDVESTMEDNEIMRKGYWAGYLRGVAEATDQTIGELIDNLPDPQPQTTNSNKKRK